MEITVQAYHEETVRPEIGRLHAAVMAEAHDKDEVLRKVTATVSALSAALKTLQGGDPAAVTEVVVRPITTSSWRPSNRGKLQPAQYTARCTLRADFVDVAALADFAAAHGTMDGLNLQHVEWRLTEATRRDIEAACVTKAVIAARERALIMARAAGETDVRCLEVTDPGLLGDHSREMADIGFAKGGAMMMRAGGAVEMEGIEIQPDDLTLAATVHARFSTV